MPDVINLYKPYIKVPFFLGWGQFKIINLRAYGPKNQSFTKLPIKVYKQKLLKSVGKINLYITN